MKRFIAVSMCVLLVFTSFTACGSEAKQSGSELEDIGNVDKPVTPGTPDVQDGPDNGAAAGWGGFSSAFTRADGSQYNNATLQIKDLGDGAALFGFDMMEGSETEDSAEEMNISGVFVANSDLTGTYEAISETGETLYSIHFQLAEDGQILTVTHEGSIDLNPDGTYEWMDAFVQADEGMAIALIENLPTAATSLNGNLGAYTVSYQDSGVLDYFYPVTATFDDTGAVLADFLVTGDLTAVWRIDTEDGVPALLFGEAQTMLDQVVYWEPEESADSEAETSPEASPLLDVMMENGTFLRPGTTGKLLLDSPYPFAFSIAEPLSVYDDVATVSEDGVVTAHSAGTTTITGTIVVEDGRRSFMMDITVGEEGEEPDAEGDDLAYWNGLDFGPNLGYAEEYENHADPGEYMNAAEAAKQTFNAMKSGSHIPEYRDDTEYTMVLVSIADIKGEPCYLYRLDDEGVGCAYAYQSGNVYYEESGGAWVQAE
ncbi:MAG: hypothetical protein QM697_06985 [Lachnospiraceae bacterium]